MAWVFIEFFPRLYSGWQGMGTYFPVSGTELLSWDLERMSRVGAQFRTLAVGALVLGSFWGMGRGAFALLGLDPPGPIRCLLEIACGFFLNDLFWLGSGLVGLWNVWVAGSALLLAVLLLARGVLRSKPKIPSPRMPRGWDLGMALVVIVYGAALLLQDLLPETFYDALNYFLGIPAYWWGHHGIVDHPLHLFSGLPHGGGLIYWPGFLLDGGPGAKVLSGAFLLGSALLAWAWTGEWKGGPSGWTAAAAVLSFPLLYLNAWAARVDGLATFLGLLFFYTVQRTIEGRKAGAWSCLGAMLGCLALSVKPTSAGFLAGGILCLGLAGQARVLWTRALPAGVLLGLLFVAPWLLKNGCYTGDVLFPYFTDKFGFRTIAEPGYHRMLHENQQFLPMDPGFLSRLTLPWRLTMPGSGDGQFLGPLLLAFLPFLLWPVLCSSRSRWLGWAFWASAALGLTLSHMLRFSLPALTLGLFLVCSGEGTGKKGGTLVRWSVLLSAALCFPEFLSLGSLWTSGGPFWIGREDRDQYLARRLGPDDMAVARWANENLPADARILFVGDARVLYYERQTLAQTSYDEAFFARAARGGKDSAGILRDLRELGVTHVVFQQGLGSLLSKEYHQYDALSRDQWRLLWRFSQVGLEPLFVRGAVGLFKVRERVGPPDAKARNPFSLFPPRAGDVLAAIQGKDPARSAAGLREMNDLFPEDPFWSSLRGRMDPGTKAGNHE